MTSDDDEFERRLRDVLHDRQLSIAPAPDALDRVHAGVRRRHQHRLLASGVAAMAVVALAAGGVVLHSNTDRARPVSLPLRTASAAPTTATPSIQPKLTSSPPQLSSAAVQATAPAPATVQLSIASFTAVGVQSYWVLGATPGCSAGCTGVERTSDGGKTFERVGVTNTKTALPALANGTDTSSTVSDIRFADATHGWIYGGALLATSDAGDTWTPVAMPGLVVDLAAVHGTAWAVVQTTSGSKTVFTLYRSDYAAAGTDAGWNKVTLPISVAAIPSLAVQGSTAYLLTETPESKADVNSLLILPVKGAITEVAGPCLPGLDVRLSAGASKSILWAVCGGGQRSTAYVTANNGSSWTTVPLANPSETLGGISATTAVFGQTSGPLVLLSSTGATTPVTEPVASLAGFDFIGFTNATEGFAVAGPPTGGGQLWRTTDAGHTWSAVAIAS
jgi:photosystem II stability/assembly factor-like uncharacterized protein